MVDPVFERDLAAVDEEIAKGDRGLPVDGGLLRVILGKWVSRVTRWQWVIHGETAEYRRQLVLALLEKGRWKKARMAALCGRGDRMLEAVEGGRVRVQPHGCGHRLCPRCSRRPGRRYVRRVCSHLAARPHGELWHFVLTQRADRDSSLSGAKMRFDHAWKRFYRALVKAGMTAGLATYHVKARREGGWHYHLHLVAEVSEGALTEARQLDLQEAWWKAKGEVDGGRTPFFARCVCDAGPAMRGLVEGEQGEFWTESRDPIEKALQYVVRDVVQGVESWVSAAPTTEAVAEFCRVVGNQKLHRCYGSWRKPVADEVEEKDSCEEKGKVPEGGTAGEKKWIAIGSMDMVLALGERGDQRSVRAIVTLLSQSNTRSALCCRLRKASQRIAA